MTTISKDFIVKNGIVVGDNADVAGSVTAASFSGDGSALTGTATSFTANNVTTNANLTGGVTSVGNAATVVTNANLTGEATSVGNATTLTNSAVIGKVITGYTSGAGVVAATDTILQAIQKLNGNTAASGSGTVTSVSVVTANGLAGTVATSTTTPAITLTTSVTGVIKGNGTALSAATSGTDYSLGTSALTTGIIKSTTTTGALTIAIAADFPTLNQSTTGNAATATNVAYTGLTGTVPTWNQNTTGTSAGITDDSTWMKSRGGVVTASVDTATSNGFYTQNNPGDSQGLLVFNPGGSLGPLQMTFTYSGLFQFRNKTDSATWNAWKNVLTSLNYNSYSPTLTGTGASGTWGISITGNAATATNVAYSGLTGTVPTWNQNTTGSAATLTTARTIALTGDVTYTSGTFNGSANVTGTATLASVGTAGTYTKVTTDAKGRVTSGTTLVAADIPALDAAKITTGTIDAARLPSYVDDVIEGANLAAFPATGETGKIYVALDTNKTYRWSGSAYVYITSGAVDSVAGKTGVVTLVKGDVGLGNVDNTADSVKSVASAAVLTTARTINGVSFNGSAAITVTANTTNALTIGTGLSGTSFNGGSAVTIAIDSTVATLTGTQTLTNKTIAAGSNTISGLTNANLSGTAGITNANLANSSVTVGTTAIALGASSTTLAGLTSVTSTSFVGALTGNASTATSASQIDGIEFRNGNSTNPVNPDTINDNGIGYITSVSLLGQIDGALYSQAYSSSWVHQIFGDYRTGQMAVRGRNTGTLTAWRNIVDSVNYTSYSPTLTGTGASGTWGISITGNAATATNQSGGTVNATTGSFTGNVGIGTASPAQKLSIQGASFVSSSFNGQSIGDGAAERIRIGYKDGTPDTGLVPSQIIATTAVLQLASRDIGTGAITFATGTGIPERMRLDSSGNLGLGVTPSAWNGLFKAIQVGGLSSFGYDNSFGQTIVTNNAYGTGSGTYAYLNATSLQAARYEQKLGTHAWFTAPAGTAGNAITFTQAMTLDASGNLGIGTASPSAWSGLNVIEFGGGNFTGSNNGNGLWSGNNTYYNGTNWIYKTTAAVAYYSQQVGIHSWHTAASGTAGTTAPFGERMRIHNSGGVSIGNTTDPGATNLSVTGSVSAASLTIGTGGTYAAGSIYSDANWGMIFRAKQASPAIAQYKWSDSADTELMRLTTGGTLTIPGTLFAASKSFLIPHPTKPGMKLRYGSLEGPENGVYIRGKLKDNNTIELPEYWTKLVDPDSITVSLTPIGKHQNLYVESIENNKVVIANGNLINKNVNCFFVVYGERIDIDKLVVESE